MKRHPAANKGSSSNISNLSMWESAAGTSMGTSMSSSKYKPGMSATSLRKSNNSSARSIYKKRGKPPVAKAPVVANKDELVSPLKKAPKKRDKEKKNRTGKKRTSG